MFGRNYRVSSSDTRQPGEKRYGHLQVDLPGLLAQVDDSDVFGFQVFDDRVKRSGRREGVSMPCNAWTSPETVTYSPGMAVLIG